MRTFVMMTKISPQGADLVELASRLQDRDRMGTTWVDKVKEKCPEVKFLAHYALLGPWDFMDIYMAPDEETAARVSLISRAHGAYQVESWVAIPNKRLAGTTDGISQG